MLAIILKVHHIKLFGLNFSLNEKDIQLRREKYLDFCEEKCNKDNKQKNKIDKSHDKRNKNDDDYVRKGNRRKKCKIDKSCKRKIDRKSEKRGLRKRETNRLQKRKQK